jgi:SAM-dependent methyltransferase
MLLETKKLIRKRLKATAQKIPLLYVLYEYWMKFRTTEAIFTDIYERKGWNGKNSVSGPGSDISQTRIVVNELPILFKEFKISTILDIPCGDFYWMKDVDLTGIDYLGADIVKSLVQNNREKYTRYGLQFVHLDLINDQLPKVDLVFCRDCLVHFSFGDVLLALENICNSKSHYLLTTTFTDRKENLDIMTGQWRPLNLELAPFQLPKPLKILPEGCTEVNGFFKDKALGLWNIEDIQESIIKK